MRFCEHLGCNSLYIYQNEKCFGQKFRKIKCTYYAKHSFVRNHKVFETIKHEASECSRITLCLHLVACIYLPSSLYSVTAFLLCTYVSLSFYLFRLHFFPSFFILSLQPVFLILILFIVFLSFLYLSFSFCFPFYSLSISFVLPSTSFSLPSPHVFMPI
jgi:hypothetical protein